MTASPGQPPRMPRGARIGTMVGFTAWVGALAVVLLAIGHADLLLPVAVPLLLVSIGLALLVLLVGERVDARRRPTVIAGTVQISVGAMVLLADAKLTPLFAWDPAMERTLGWFGGMPAAVSFAVVQLVVGIALLRRALRDAGTDATPG